jgi:hypothetical protein
VTLLERVTAAFREAALEEFERALTDSSNATPQWKAERAAHGRAFRRASGIVERAFDDHRNARRRARRRRR